jgi:hypothetical protein
MVIGITGIVSLCRNHNKKEIDNGDVPQSGRGRQGWQSVSPGRKFIVKE